MEDQIDCHADQPAVCGSISSRRPRGFTLLETMIVMAVLGVAALIVVPSLNSAEPHKLNLLAAELAAAYVHARDEAQRTSMPHGVDFSVGSTQIKLFRADQIPPDNLYYDLYRPVTKTPYDFKLNDETVLGDVDIDVTEALVWNGACNNPQITFDAAGRPSCNGVDWGVQLSSAVFTLTSDGHIRTVLIEGETGRVSVK